MSLLNVVVPVLTAMGGLLRERQQEVADKTGLSVETVNKVGGAVSDLLTGDEKAVAAIMAEVERARVHDGGMTVANAMPFVALLRGLVRPVITMMAFLWYVYARCTGVEVAPEDYAIIGGILAFWFGLRPFEKGGDTLGTVAWKAIVRGK